MYGFFVSYVTDGRDRPVQPTQRLKIKEAPPSQTNLVLCNDVGQKTTRPIVPSMGQGGSTNGTAIHGPMNGTGEIKVCKLNSQIKK